AGWRARLVEQYGTGLFVRPAADVVDPEARLAWGAADVLRARADRDGPVRGARSGRGRLPLPARADLRRAAAAGPRLLVGGRRVLLLGLRLALGLGGLGLRLLLVGRLLGRIRV